ncbi:hypothetical protein [uncultured Mycobacterium sp.]|uniref:hypothetical protein n=1 Tax=uncultured Mycobacterium sp. TaxID=171292 RepID=UPI0035CC98E8
MPFIPAHFFSGSSLDDTTAHHKGPSAPQLGRFTLYPNGTLSAIKLLLLGVGWLRFRRGQAC